MSLAEESTLLHVSKLIFICFKISIILVFMVMGAIAHISSTNKIKINSVVKLFSLYVLVMGVLCFYEFYMRTILVLYVALVLAGLAHVYSFSILLGIASKYQDKKISDQCKILSVVFVAGFACLFIFIKAP